MRKTLAAMIGAVSVTAVLGGASLAAASDRTAVSGTEHFQFMTTSATSKTSSIIATGVFTAGGTSTDTSNTTATVKFPNGTFVITHSKGTGTVNFNPKTCLLKGNLKGTYKLGSGTGAYAHLSGSGTSRQVLGGAAVERESEHPLGAFQQVFPPPAPRRSRISRATAPWPRWTAGRWPWGTPA
jgi:hypothetical protein